MKNVFVFICVILFSIRVPAQLGYYYDSEFIELLPSKDSLNYIEFKEYQKGDVNKAILKNELDVLYTISDNQIVVKGSTNLNKEWYISPLYTNPKRYGNVIVLPEIILSTSDNEVVRSILNKYKEYIHLESIIRGKKYKLSCKTESAEDVLRLVGIISRMENVDWCEPNMISNIKSSSDPYYPYQFYLNNTDAEGVDINVVPAWTLITGDSNVKVAVLDEGVDIYHEDFEGNVLSGYSVNSPYGLGNVINSTFNHGTSCAGIIAAVHNNIGVRGVAGGVKILPVNITKGTRDNFGNTIFSEHDSIANAIRWAVDHGADILSCSWGGNFESNSITDAIIYARTFGRLGKGSVVVAASGNYFESLPYVVMFPARANGVVAVGAVDRDGTICDYSQRGAMLDIVAPSKKSYNTEGIYTTYNMGEGNIGNNYTSTFGGTSAACPQVAGVAALMLSANPYLSEEQVRSRLQSTATDLGETGFDSTYGYGLVNAFAAVKASIMDMLGSTVLCGSKFYSVANLPTGASVSWSLINGNISCVSLQSDSPSANQCTLTLTNSSGFNSVTLKADVIMSGTVVKSLQKVISRALPFSGTYEEASLLYNGSFTPSIPQTTIPGSREMDVYVGGLVKVKSDYFSGKSISISGPYTNYDRSGSLVRFTLSSWSGAPVVITVQAEGCDDEVRLKFFPAIMLDDYSLNISPDGNSTYALSLIRKTEDGVLPETSSAADDCAAPRLFSKPWTLEVTNALTGRKTFSKEVDEPTFLLHTDGWEAGVYVVRALVGDESLAGKITVK